MAAGFTVEKGLVDARAGEAARDLRDVLERIERLKLWLDDHPGYDAESHLVSELGFTTDDAYLIHDVFTQLDAIRTTHAAALANARKLTGLE